MDRRQHLGRVVDCFLCDFDAPQHARNLPDLVLFSQRVHAGFRRGFVAFLAHQHVLLALGRNLWQVGDTQHLSIRTQRDLLLIMKIWYLTAQCSALVATMQFCVRSFSKIGTAALPVEQKEPLLLFVSL